MTYQKDLATILPILQSLQRHIFNRQKFAYDIDWMNYYLNYFQNIFFDMNQTDDWVSQDFHVYFEHNSDRFEGYIPNQKGCQVRFDI